MTGAYEKIVSWTFEAGGTTWEITEIHEDYLCFEDTRKDGQEDTHMGGVIELLEGRWALEPDTREQIETYGSAAIAEAVGEYINRHGPPE